VNSVSAKTIAAKQPNTNQYTPRQVRNPGTSGDSSFVGGGAPESSLLFVIASPAQPGVAIHLESIWIASPLRSPQ
jgi:hypothetical protein